MNKITLPPKCPTCSFPKGHDGECKQITRAAFSLENHSQAEARSNRKVSEIVMFEYPIRPDTKNSVVQQATMQLRKDGYSASWLDGKLRTNATRSEIAMSVGMVLFLKY